MVSQPPKDTPFGLEVNVAAGLAWLLGIVGGIIMLVGGGTNKVVRWAAAQSIVLWAAWIILWVALGIVWAMTIAVQMFALYPLFMILRLVLGLAVFVAWIVGVIGGFQGKDVRLPVIAGISESIFRSMLV